MRFPKGFYAQILMKKLLAITLAALMAFSMAACNEEEKDDDSAISNNSSVVDDGSSEDDDGSDVDDGSSEDDDGSDVDDGSSEDDDGSDVDDGSSEDDDGSDVDDGSSEDDGSDVDDGSSEDDDISDVDDITTASGTIENGVITVQELTMTVDDTWTIVDQSGQTYFVPADYETYGNNVNIIRQAYDAMFDSYSKEIFETQLQAFMGEDFKVSSFERTTINGTDAILMSYEYSGFILTQVMLNTDDCSFIVTFTGTGGTFEDVTPFIETIEVK